MVFLGESRQWSPPPNSFKEDENPQKINNTIFKGMSVQTC